MSVTEIRIAGFGGQGVILAATVIGKAACIFQQGYSTMTQAFGPEARGGACSAQLIMSDQPVLYPYVTAPDILVVMSQEAFAKFGPEIKPGGIMLVEEELVRVTNMKPGVRVYGVPATRLAEELGKKMIMNIVMTGFFGAITGIVSNEALRKAVGASVPPSFRELNLKAYDSGFEFGKKVVEESLTTVS